MRKKLAIAQRVALDKCTKTYYSVIMYFADLGYCILRSVVCVLQDMGILQSAGGILAIAAYIY